MSVAPLARRAILLLLLVAAVWNAVTYPPGRSYDAHHHTAYLEGLWERGELPTEGAYYTPPGYFAVAGALVQLGERAGLGEPRRLAQALNGALALGTALVLLALAETLWPKREVLSVAALGLFALGPWVPKAAAMFHPEPLDLFLCTVALLGATRMLVRRRFELRTAAFVGLMLGAAQLVRAFSLWTVAVVLFGFVAAVLLRPGLPRERRAALKAGAVLLGVALLVPLPWYVRQATTFGDPVFAPAAPERPLWERRPASFYVDPALPEVLTAPHRPQFDNRFLPQLYADAWGDYFGVFAWDAAEGRPDERERRRLVAQSLVGVVPTALALGGWALLLWAGLARRRPELVPVALLPLAGLAGMLYFGMAHPTPDGDVIKAQYMLTTAPAWALAFGLAVDRLRAVPGVPLLLGAVLLLSALVSWTFTLYGYPLGA
jgi:hypothetical protein